MKSLALLTDISLLWVPFVLIGWFKVTKGNEEEMIIYIVFCFYALLHFHNNISGKQGLQNQHPSHHLET